MKGGSYRPASRELAHAVSIAQMLRQIGWRVRYRNRADCGLCRGKSNGTIAFTERLWKCHRCNEGGDVFSLVRGVNRCDFVQALRFVAELAGIRVDDHRSADPRRKLAARKRERERVEDGANKLAALEHALLRERRDRIHDAERTCLRVSERLAELARGERQRFRLEQESLCLTLQAATTLLNCGPSRIHAAELWGA